MSADQPESRESSEVVVDSDSYPAGLVAARRARGPRRNAARVIVMLVFGWSITMLSAVVIAAVISFLEVQRACGEGFGESGGGRAGVAFRAGISVTCENRDGIVEIPMNGAAAVVLFGGFGLAVTLLLMLAYAAFRR